MSSKIRRVVSSASDPVAAARELHGGLAGPDLALVLFFCAPEYAVAGFAAEIARLFDGVPVAGCTSAGEIGPGGYHENSVTAIGLARPDFDAVVGLLVTGGTPEIGAIGTRIDALRSALDERVATSSTEARCFAVLLADSTTRREEALATMVGGALPDMPVIGGSAGDALLFERSAVFAEGSFHDEGAALVLVGTNRPVRTFRSQHFVASERRVVVTLADPGRRIVAELDAEPAVECYARLVGLPVAELTPMVFASNPLVVRLGGSEYVRSIQKANPDGSLSFYCAIDEGLVLTLAEGRDLIRRTQELFGEIGDAIGAPEAVIGFECVLNRLEAERGQVKRHLSQLHAANNVTGFASFGEQWGSTHVNQTFTGIAIGRGEA